MSAGVGIALPPQAAAWNTLRILKAALYTLWAFAALLLIASITGTRLHRAAMQSIGKDAAPSIIAAQHIKTALADMDANAANELLAPTGRSEAFQQYETRRNEAAKALIAAAQNITYGEAERAPIERIEVGLGQYEALVQRARDLDERHDPSFVVAYRDSASLLDKALLPAADALDQANLDVLEETYAAQGARSFGARAFLVFSGALLIGFLFALQGLLSRRTHRTFNLMLVGATIVSVGFVIYSFRIMGSEERQLKVAKEDAFTSIHALWRGRALAYAANADESRYLLDSQHSAEHEQAFFGKVHALAAVPQDMTIEAVARDLPPSGKSPGFSGYLANELANITFEGERDAAIDTLVRFGRYVAIDRQIRGLERAGKHAEAIALCLGTKKGESNWAFDQFDTALGTTLEINQRAFDKAVDSGLNALAGFELRASITTVIIAVLIFLGLMPRIKEYE